jgi:hypothetical protein
VVSLVPALGQRVLKVGDGFRGDDHDQRRH